ncbi:MAG: hypothetical protein AB7P40_00065 [Chloroflexota bacterium]
MSDLVVTVPKGMWASWIQEGDLPGQEAEYESHFWVHYPEGIIQPGERVYVVAHGRLRGYAPLVRTERICTLSPRHSCLVREGGAVAVTIAEPIQGFRGVRRRWWDLADEIPFPAWQTEGVR